MPESTILILDNSDYAINGDYEPTRWMAQLDAAGLLIQTKLEQSHENSMGVALSAGKHPEIICTPSNDITKVTSYLYGIKLHGPQQLSIALQTSALALKHRINPNPGQRIICFVASTLNESVEELKLICKKLKKNSIALDLVALGDLSSQQKETLQAMHEAVKTDRTCELIYVETDTNLSDRLFSSSILGVEAGPAPVMNEAEDPELMMALQLSLQEEEQRVALENRRDEPGVGNEDEELQQRALQLSMQEKEGDNNEEDKKE